MHQKLEPSTISSATNNDVKYKTWNKINKTIHKWVQWWIIMVARKLELDTIAIAKESQCQAQHMKQNTRQKSKRKLHDLKYITQLDNNIRRGLTFRNQDAAWTIDTRSWW